MRLGDLVEIRWRDHFYMPSEVRLEDVKDDCVWVTVGWVVRITDHFVLLARDQEETSAGNVGGAIGIAHNLILKTRRIESGVKRVK